MGQFYDHTKKPLHILTRLKRDEHCLHKDSNVREEMRENRDKRFNELTQE
jgi:hypothetical protein